MNTLKPLLNDKWFGNMLSGPEEQADVLIAFWDGINLHFQNSEENPFDDTKGFQFRKNWYSSASWDVIAYQRVYE